MATAILDAKAVGAQDDWAINGAGTKPEVMHDALDSTNIQGLIVNDKQEFTLGRSNGTAPPGTIPRQIGNSTSVEVNVRQSTTISLTSCTITFEFFNGTTDLSNSATIVLSAANPNPADHVLNFSDIAFDEMSDLRIRATVTAIAGVQPGFNILEMNVTYTYTPAGMRLRRSNRPRLP